MSGKGAGLLQDDRVMSVLTGLIIVIGMAMLAQRSDELIDFLFAERAAQITPQDDTASVAAGASVVIDVLANDENAAPDDAAKLRLVASPACGAAEVTDAGILYVANSNCLGDQKFTYCVARGDECRAAAVTVTVAPAAE